jgi:hypothetical protein
MPNGRVITACAALLLTGCDVGEGAKGSLEEATPPEAAAVETEDDATAALPAPAVEPETAAPSDPEFDVAALRPVEKPPPPPRKGRPDDLLQLAADDLKTKLGAPAAKRDEPPARVWRYATEDCALEVFLFLEVTENVRRVLAYDIATPGGSADDDLACYREIEHRHAVTLRTTEPR